MNLKEVLWLGFFRWNFQVLVSRLGFNRIVIKIKGGG